MDTPLPWTREAAQHLDFAALHLLQWSSPPNSKSVHGERWERRQQHQREGGYGCSFLANDFSAPSVVAHLNHGCFAVPSAVAHLNHGCFAAPSAVVHLNHDSFAAPSVVEHLNHGCFAATAAICFCSGLIGGLLVTHWLLVAVVEDLATGLSFLILTQLLCHYL